MRQFTVAGALLVLALTLGGAVAQIPPGCADGSLALLLSGAIGVSLCSTDDGFCQADSCPGNLLGKQTVCTPGASNPCGDLECQLVFPGTCTRANGDKCWGIMVCPTGAADCPTDLLGRVCISKSANQPTVCEGIPVPCPTDPSPPSPTSLSSPSPSPPSPSSSSSLSPPAPGPPSPSNKQDDKFPKFDQEKGKFTWGPRGDGDVVDQEVDDDELEEDVQDKLVDEDMDDDELEAGSGYKGPGGNGPHGHRRLFGFWW